MMKKSTIPVAVTAMHRFVFVITFGVTGFIVGREIDLQVISLHLESGLWQGLLRIGMPIIGACIGVGVSPLAQGLFETELAIVEDASERLTPFEIGGATTGLCVGLLIALLLRALLGGIIAQIGMSAEAILVLAGILLCVFSTYLGLRVGGRAMQKVIVQPSEASPAVLDTSAIIDGRILDVVRCGFLEGPFLLPRFILLELQSVADSSDAVRRARGRRGLELLEELRAMIDVRIVDASNDASVPVDVRLLRFARESGAKMITTDYNLNRVARLEGVKVMNVNELGQALRPAMVAGQVLEVSITKEGREADQGVGYLDDGTMIVVEGGRVHIGEALSVVVTSVLQTAAGRMVFARVNS